MKNESKTVLHLEDNNQLNKKLPFFKQLAKTKL